MSTAGPYGALEGIGAIALAMEASADLVALEATIEKILERCPQPGPGDTKSVELLVESVRASRAEFSLVEHRAVRT